MIKHTYGNYNHEEYTQTQKYTHQTLAEFSKYPDGTLCKRTIAVLGRGHKKDDIRTFVRDKLGVNFDDYRDGCFSSEKNGQWRSIYHEIENKPTLTDDELELLNRHLAKIPYFQCSYYYDSLFDVSYIYHRDMCGPKGTWDREFEELSKVIGVPIKQADCYKSEVSKTSILRLLKSIKIRDI